MLSEPPHGGEYFTSTGGVKRYCEQDSFIPRLVDLYTNKELVTPSTRIRKNTR